MSSIKRFRIIKWKKDRPVLSAKSISKSYGRKMVLRKIDLELRRGEMLGFLGSNGAGKSTFMSIILGLQKKRLWRCFSRFKKNYIIANTYTRTNGNWIFYLNNLQFFEAL